MIPNKHLTNLSRRQRQAWCLKNERGWNLDRIGRAMGIRRAAVCRLLRRARLRAGLAAKPRRGRSKWRVIQPLSLSRTFDA